LAGMPGIVRTPISTPRILTAMKVQERGALWLCDWIHLKRYIRWFIACIWSDVVVFILICSSASRCLWMLHIQTCVHHVFKLRGRWQHGWLVVTSSFKVQHWPIQIPSSNITTYSLSTHAPDTNSKPECPKLEKLKFKHRFTVREGHIPDFTSFRFL